MEAAALEHIFAHVHLAGAGDKAREIVQGEIELVGLGHNLSPVATGTKPSRPATTPRSASHPAILEPLTTTEAFTRDLHSSENEQGLYREKKARAVGIAD